jgi:hypothetical protein
VAFVAGLIEVEKTLPWRQSATYATAGLLAALGLLLLSLLLLSLLLLIAPDTIPALTIPSHGPMPPMSGMTP